MEHRIGQTRYLGANCIVKRVARKDVIDMVLEFVHPSNLGVLPPSLDVLIYKATQTGLATREYSAPEVCVLRKGHTAELDAELQARLRDTYYGV